MYAGDMTADETLSASASTWNCHNGTIVLIARCTSCKCRPPLCCFTASFGGRQGATSLNHSSRTSLAASLIIVRMR